MRILHIAPPFFPIQEGQGYGGIERVVLDLVEEQKELDVHIAAPRGTILPGQVHETVKPLGFFDRTQRTDYAVLEHVNNTLEVIRKIKPHVVHNHDDYFFPFMNLLDIPSLLTLHAPYEDFWNKEKNNVFRNQYLIAISHKQKTLYQDKGIPIYEVVYNGINIEKYTFNRIPQKYLLSLSSIRPEKGQDIAIEFFDRIKDDFNFNLIIAGNIANDTYFKEKIKPRITHDLSAEKNKLKAYSLLKNRSPKIIYTGEVNDSQKIPLFQYAQAFIFPVTIEESFGLVAIESLACGTPVIATSFGGIPEIINKHSGYLLQDHDYISALEYCLQLSRHDCRKRVVDIFSRKKMSDDYLKIYHGLYGR